MLLFLNNINVYESKKSFNRHLSWLIFQLKSSKSIFNSGNSPGVYTVYKYGKIYFDKDNINLQEYERCILI